MSLVPDRLLDYSDKALLAELRRCARAAKGRYLSEVLFNQIARVSAVCVAKRFGTWRAALRKAGVPDGNKYVADANPPPEACLDNLKRLWTELGHMPRVIDASFAPSRYASGVYRRHFGSWRRALKALLLREKGGDYSRFVLRRDKAAPASRITDALRYRILKRDRYTCVACGASPAKDPSVKLELDHIVPLSKGGSSLPGNLRTLCRRCNIGKGGR